MISRFWNCKDLAFVAMIVALACVAAFLSIKLMRPKPLARATLGVEWQCEPSLVFATCHRIAHVRPVRPSGKPA
jgi:hypothetical protein